MIIYNGILVEAWHIWCCVKMHVSSVHDQQRLTVEQQIRLLEFSGSPRFYKEKAGALMLEYAWLLGLGDTAAYKSINRRVVLGRFWGSFR